MDSKSVLRTLTSSDFRKDVLRAALCLEGEDREELFRLARKRRREFFSSKTVEVRSVVEISNICQRKCNFCNINFYSRNKRRYSLDYGAIIKIIENLYNKDRRIFLLQSGENRSQRYLDFVCNCIKGIKQEFKDLTLILSLGRLARDQYKQLRISGADRYILKFETSNPALYKRIKPDDSLGKRIKAIKMLSELGFKVGSGNIIGLPNQTIDDIVNDLLFIGNFNLTMASASIFIPGENSNYWDKPKGNLDITLNYMALMRILYPQMLIPSTSSLEKAQVNGQYLGLMAGANAVTIHDGTPQEFKKHYPIYSIKRFTPDEKRIRRIVSKSGLFLK